jgi:flagellar biosynthesis protein FlhF
MKLKSYFAATVEAAMSMARLELGDDAMLVSTKRTGDDQCHLGDYEVVFATTPYPDGRALLPAQHQGGQVTAVKARPIDKLSDEVSSLKREMEKLASALSRSNAGIASIAANAHLAEAFSQLVAAELDASIAQDLVGRVTSQIEDVTALTSSTARRLIASELSRLLNVDSRLPASSEKNAIVLVGPPGVGKTTALVKLAVLYGLRTRRPSQILSLDSHRVAATEPLRSYASITGLAFRALETPRALAQALEEHRSKDLIFIDTPGLARGDFDDAAEMAKLVSRHHQMETHLVLSASMKPADMRRIAQQYDIFSPAKLLFPHLDETTTFGPLLTLSLRTGKPISFLSRGPQIPEDLEPAGKQALIDLVLKEMQPARDELISTAVA